MGPSRIRDLSVGFLLAAVIGYLVIRGWYRVFPPITLLSGVSLLVVATAEAVWGVSVRARIRAGAIGIGPGRLHPLAVARTVSVAKASAWMGALVFGWWIGALTYLIPRRSELRVAAADTPGALVAAGSALALVIAGMWLQNCCKSPGDPLDPNEPDS
jgi:hypothetical protein